MAKNPTALGSLVGYQLARRLELPEPARAEALPGLATVSRVAGEIVRKGQAAYLDTGFILADIDGMFRYEVTLFSCTDVVPDPSDEGAMPTAVIELNRGTFPRKPPTEMLFLNFLDRAQGAE